MIRRSQRGTKARRERWARLVSSVAVVAVAWAGALGFSAFLLAAADYETPPTLKASEVLPAEMQRGEHFVVREEVHNDGYMNYYRVDSDFGQFEAYGNVDLAKLIQEIDALTQLDEVSKSEVFLDAVQRSATGQVEAIKEFADKPVETVKGIPGGLKRTFRKYKRDAKEGYEVAKDVSGDVTDTVTGGGGSDQGEGAEEGEGTESSRSDEAKELAGKTSDAAEAYAKKWFGVSAAERRWHQKLGTDPYTRNEVLRKKVKSVSRVDAATSTGMRFAPIPRIPGASELLRMNQIVWSMDPRELREQNVKRLAEAGVEPDLIDSFINNPWYSPSQQTLLLSGLNEMEGVGGLRLVLEIAANAESTEEAQFDLANAMFLAAFHLSESPITRLLPGQVAAAMTAENRMVTIVSVDYAFWTEDLAGAVLTFVNSVREQPADSRELWLRGRASPRFEKELAGFGWTVREAIDLDPRPPQDSDSKTGI